MLDRQDSRTVLVTGAGGVLGRVVCRLLANFGYKVIGHTRVSAVDEVCNDKVCFSLEDTDKLMAVCTGLAPEWIIHTAANTNVDSCERRPEDAAKIHVEGSYALALAAARSGARLLYISTDSVYDGELVGAHSESDPLRPLNVYAHTKLSGEKACLLAAEDTIVARVNFFSLDPQIRRGLAHNIQAQLFENMPFTGFTDVDFSPLSAYDLALTLLAILQKNLPGGIYNLGASDSCSKYTFAKMLAEYAGADASLVHEARLADSPLLALRPRNTVMNSNRLAVALGSKMPTVRDSLRAEVARGRILTAVAANA